MSDSRPGEQPGQFPGQQPVSSVLWPQGSAGVTTTPPSTTQPPVDEDPAGGGRRRRVLLVGGIAAAVLVVGGITTALVLSGDDDVVPAAAAATVFLPTPTPTVEPVARTATSAFASALPTTVLQFALASSADDPEWFAAGAIEAYTETFTDGGTGQVVVQAGQWETAAEADAHVRAVVAALPVAGADASADSSADPSAAPDALVAESGDVTVAGAVVGSFTIVPSGAEGVVVWSNGTTAFRATGPAASIRDFYLAFPL
ncbi:hypothetical protein ACGIF2_16560 [Cellulomonas sp. P22]|uniref:hypothetical protein n=1 Tax=Cellulomonas sp. P22 TaxID=3373189 RepID=UPI00378F63CB